jgi:hypothetical protein
MNERTILIYDDESKNGAGYEERLKRSDEVKKHFTKIECINNTDFLKEMDELRDRQKAVRNGDKRKDNELRLDAASILIVDYDLVNAPDKASFLTGEIVSYYVRCFSRCRYIIGLNQFGTNNFDLTLKRHPRSYADLNIGSDQIDNSGLWGGIHEGFRPWYWPSIPKSLTFIDKKISDLERNFKTPICQFFGMPPEIIATLPRSMSEFLGDHPESVSFEKFIEESGNTLIPKDKKNIDINNSAIKILIVSRISKWLEEVVLPGQNILIDAPHLVHRYPSLLTGNNKDLATWNNTALLDTSDKKLGLNFEVIEKFKIKNDHWLSRPAWFLNQLIDCPDIKEVKEPWSRESTNYVFCEDSSTFYPKNDCKEFLIEIDTPYARRYVREFERVSYVPRVRFAL